MIDEPTSKEIMDLFPEWYEGYVVAIEIETVREIDDELGLEIVQKQTLEDYIGKRFIKDNSFTRSLREQFDRNGYLSKKQIECLK